MNTALDPDKYSMMNFEETELRLGLPGSGKRGYLETVDLVLNLSSMEPKDSAKENRDEGSAIPTQSDPAKPPAKAQVVGWPPIRSFRKNVMAVQKPAFEEEGEKLGTAFVKVSVDGAPYLRKVDLKLYKSYTELSTALSKMLVSFPIGQQKEASHVDLLSRSDYVPTYEDKDGDWMLVGDVPWDMFVDSCKRLRVMKGSDAIGLGT